MSRCSNAVVDGAINGLVLGFAVGAALSFFRCCNSKTPGLIIQEGFRWAGPGAVFLGSVAALRHCL